MKKPDTNKGYKTDSWVGISQGPSQGSRDQYERLLLPSHVLLVSLAQPVSWTPHNEIIKVRLLLLPAMGPTLRLLGNASLQNPKYVKKHSWILFKLGFLVWTIHLSWITNARDVTADLKGFKCRAWHSMLVYMRCVNGTETRMCPHSSHVMSYFEGIIIQSHRASKHLQRASLTAQAGRRHSTNSFFKNLKNVVSMIFLLFW